MPEYKNMLAVSAYDVRPPTTLRVAMHSIASDVCCASQVGWSARRSAAAPDTCGHAIDVPDMIAVAVSDETPAASTDDPGAKMSTHGPTLEKLER